MGCIMYHATEVGCQHTALNHQFPYCSHTAADSRLACAWCCHTGHGPGNIGSCWAISAVGAIEGLHKIRTRRLVSLSSQQIYDCSNKSVIDSHLKAFNWVLHNGGGYQPVTVRMSLDRTSFQNYTGGIFSGPCGNDGHSMLAVGYGATADGRKYWIVKILMGVVGVTTVTSTCSVANHGPGLCGLANYAAYPV
ncbi:hypothetical protein ZWY2020_052018 [Hordeum vulgare]|nr:hypothetical protein ZWY2020_052018 [Hordeum vulgare]